MSLLDDVFDLLEMATRLEKGGGNRIEAATKIINGSLEQYYEAVYLMKTVLQHTPQTPESQSTRNLLEQKIEFYSAAASRLYFDDSSTAPFNVNTNPRSPTMGQQQFFSEERSVPPPPDPPVCESPRFTQSAEINRYASKANTKLSHAIDLDETGGKKQAAIDAYMAAAELYLQTIRISEQKQGVTSFTDVYKGRLEGVLDRIEQLKSNHDRQITKQPQSGYEHSQEPQNRVSSYTKKEILVLKRSSLIASGLFLPWSEGDARTLSLQVQKQSVLITLFTDKEGDLALSDKQIRRFHRWARPHEIVQMRKSFGYKQQAPTMIRSINPYTIRQAYVTDCSFIASLCICAAFEKRFRKRLITSIIYPQNSEGMPIVNPGGQYMVKLWLNGVARQVIIDDRLPIDKDSGLLCSHTTGGRNQMELWVTIIEKAYMKLCGGYDFPGSNSGVDLFSLTGWIPERIFFAKKPHKIRDFETARERAWERLFSANSFGDCLITVATSHDITEEKAETLGLVTGHAYAVLDVFQSAQDGTRLLQLKNPWASKGWRGKYSCHDLASWSNSLLQAEVGYNPELASEHDDGIFWISWDDVLLYFQNIQLSWNPALFPFCTKTHDFWPKDQGPMNDTFNVGENPQYVMILSDEALTKKATIWVLISRHVTKQEQEGAEVNDFLTVHLMRNTERKERIWYPHGKNSLVNGAYTNNPHILVRYDVTGPSDKYISLVLSQHQKSQDMGYTLSCYCTESFSLGQPQKELPYMKEISGAWTTKTAGGAVGKDIFFLNPMYILHLEEETTIQLRCSTNKAFAVNVMLIALPSGDYTDMNTRQMTRGRGKPKLDSGNYRHGFAVTERKKIDPGAYTLVVSTFNQGQVGAFSVKVSSSVKTRFDAIL